MATATCRVHGGKAAFMEREIRQEDVLAVNRGDEGFFQELSHTQTTALDLNRLGNKLDMGQSVREDEKHAVLKS